MGNSRKIEIKPSILFLCLAILLGGYIRLSAVMEAQFPLNDGGLFYTMTQNLITNGFKIPAVTTYNQLNIPFAYPPLQFWFAGLLSSWFGWQLLDLFRILPGIFSVLCIPAFYLLARDLLKDDVHAGLSTLLFALIPSTFDWLIMGGGITRAPAFCFALLTLWSAYRLYTLKEKKYIFLTAVFAAVTVLSHPETALHTAACALVFFLFFGRNKKGILRSLLVAGLTILFTLPWWLPVLTQHGLAPFAAAARTGGYDAIALIKLLLSNQIREVGLTPISVLALTGVLLYLAKKDFFLLVLLGVIYVSEPRSAPLFSTPLFAIFAGYTLIQIMHLLNTFERRESSESDANLLFSGRFSKILILLILCQGIYSVISTVSTYKDCCLLDAEDKQAFDWIKNQTASGSRFLVLTGSAPLTDPVTEWFPALTERVSLNTVQGHEWLSDRSFSTVLAEAEALQSCRAAGLECLEDWSERNQLTFDYIYLNYSSIQNDSDSPAYPLPLVDLLLESGKFTSVYDQAGIQIFQRN